MLLAVQSLQYLNKSLEAAEDRDPMFVRVLAVPLRERE